MRHRYAQLGFGDLDTGKFVPAGSKLQYNVSFSDVSFSVNWGFNWLGAGWCRQAINDAIRATGAFSDVYVVPDNLTDNNCTQSQVNLVTAIDWNIGDMRGVLNDALGKAGFEVNGSYLTITQSSRPAAAPAGTASTSSNPQSNQDNQSALTPDGGCDWYDLPCHLGLAPGTSALSGAAIGVIAVLAGILLLRRL
jgi:hypothetical protein